MNFNLSGHHVAITPALRQHVEEKLGRVARHFDHITSVNVILTVEKQQQKAECTLHVRGKDLFAEAVDSDLYTAIDSLVDKLDRTVLRYKGKQENHRHQN